MNLHFSTAEIFALIFCLIIITRFLNLQYKRYREGKAFNKYVDKMLSKQSPIKDDYFKNTALTIISTISWLREDEILIGSPYNMECIISQIKQQTNKPPLLVLMPIEEDFKYMFPNGIELPANVVFKLKSV